MAPVQRKLTGHAPGVSPWWALLFVGPTMLGLLVFYIWPVLRTLYLSMTKSGVFGGSTWVGLKNYQQLFSTPEFGMALANTFTYAAVVLLGIPIAIVVAAMLNTKNLKGKSIYRMLYFLPVVTMPAAVSLVWRLIYNGEYGIFNQLLAVFGIQGRSWLNNADTAIPAMAFVGIWMGLGTNIVIFLAGLQGIPSTLLEAAEIDGAGPISKFRHVTLPLLSPSIFFVLVISVINALQVFDLIFMMIAKTSPAFAESKTVVYLFYEQGIVNQHRGYAAAVAFALFAIVLVLTVIQFRLQKRWVHYE